MASHVVENGQDVLHDLLRARAIDPLTPGPAHEIWEVFKEFVAVPFDTTGPDSDGVLYQIGTFRFPERKSPTSTSCASSL